MFIIKKSNLTKLTEEEKQFQLDIADELKDEYASHVAWSPCKAGGNPNTTNVLKRVNSRLLVYKPSFTTLLLLLFLLSGAIFSLFAGFAINEGHSIAIGFLMSGVALLFLIIYYNNLGKKIYFDKTKKLIYKSSKPKKRIRNKSNTNYIKFDEILAIQILYERIRVRRGSQTGVSLIPSRYYGSYEINLVLKDMNRINLIDHKNESLIFEDADIIAKFLNVKIWDASHVDYDEV